MLKKLLLISLLCPIAILGLESNIETSHNDDVISSFMRLSSQQLLDTANYYYKGNSFDTALICYNLIVNTIPKNAGLEQQKNLLKAYNRLGNIYFFISDYRIAFDFDIKRLVICEKYDLIADKSITYTNIGVIYSNLNQYDIANQYFLKALDLCSDSIFLIDLLNNLGVNQLVNNKPDSSLYYLNKSLQISKQHNNLNLFSILNNFGSYYQKIKQYDSAFYCFKQSLEQCKINNNIIVETINLSDLGKLFFEVNKTDSALYYINLSNKIATENNFLKILSENHLVLSEIYRSKGKFETALNHHIIYTNLKDSVYNAGVYGSINLLQRQYEVSKTNQQIEELEIDRQIKENTIYYQKVILLIILGVLALVLYVLVFINSQKRKLNKAYKQLIDKNIEIVKIQSTPSEADKKKNKKKLQNYDKHNELLNRILIVMENPAVFCNSEFSIDRLAELVQSNQKYVSEAINSILNKNFRSFLNSYRIKEAQRLFANRETERFTIESVTPLVGFKSSKTFWEAFKEVTGVTPNLYLKSMLDTLK